MPANRKTRAKGSAANATNAQAFAERLRPVFQELAAMSANAAARELELRGVATARAAGGAPIRWCPSADAWRISRDPQRSIFSDTQFVNAELIEASDDETANSDKSVDVNDNDANAAVEIKEVNPDPADATST